MTAIQPGEAGSAWAALAASLPIPRAILITSAHWETEVPMLTGSAKPETIHDFFGFPDELYALRYPAPGAADVAIEAAELLTQAGFHAGVDGLRGLDHGAWVPLRFMYPQADVPVVELSVQPGRGAAYHLAIGRALARLRERGVLVIGSGHVTHNLRDWHAQMGAPGTLPYVEAFADWLEERLAANDQVALTEWRERAPQALRAHPTDEHLLPLFVAFGAVGESARVDRVYRGTVQGALAMDAYRFDATI